MIFINSVLMLTHFVDKYIIVKDCACMQFTFLIFFYGTYIGTVQLSVVNNPGLEITEAKYIAI